MEPPAKKAKVAGSSNVDIVVIGSRALANHKLAQQKQKSPFFYGGNNSSDYDIVVTNAGYRKVVDAAAASGTLKKVSRTFGGKKVLLDRSSGGDLDCELDDADDSSAMIIRFAEAAKNPWLEIEIFPGVTALCAPIELLAAIKRSHLIFPNNWEKHMEDYHELKKLVADRDQAERQQEIPPEELQAFTKVREEEGKARYGSSKVHMNVTNDEFFKVWYLNEMVPKNTIKAKIAPGKEIYKHDEIHQLVAYGDAPLYTTMKIDHSKAMLDRDLFESASPETQLKLVREESMAIGLERKMLPDLLRGIRKTPTQMNEEAYKVGLRMTLTTLSKGWFRDFGLENYPDVCKCDRNLLKLVNDDGRILAPTEGVSSEEELSAATIQVKAEQKLLELKERCASESEEGQWDFDAGDFIYRESESMIVKILQVNPIDAGSLKLGFAVPKDNKGTETISLEATITQDEHTKLFYFKVDDKNRTLPSFVFGVSTSESVEDCWNAGCTESLESLYATITRSEQQFLSLFSISIITRGPDCTNSYSSNASYETVSLDGWKSNTGYSMQESKIQPVPECFVPKHLSAEESEWSKMYVCRKEYKELKSKIVNELKSIMHDTQIEFVPEAERKEVTRPYDNKLFDFSDPKVESRAGSMAVDQKPQLSVDELRAQMMTNVQNTVETLFMGISEDDDEDNEYKADDWKAGWKLKNGVTLTTTESFNTKYEYYDEDENRRTLGWFEARGRCEASNTQTSSEYKLSIYLNAPGMEPLRILGLDGTYVKDSWDTRTCRTDSEACSIAHLVQYTERLQLPHVAAPYLVDLLCMIANSRVQHNMCPVNVGTGEGWGLFENGFDNDQYQSNIFRTDIRCWTTESWFYGLTESQEQELHNLWPRPGKMTSRPHPYDYFENTKPAKYQPRVNHLPCVHNIQLNSADSMRSDLQEFEGSTVIVWGCNSKQLCQPCAIFALMFPRVYLGITQQSLHKGLVTIETLSGDDSTRIHIEMENLSTSSFISTPPPDEESKHTADQFENLLADAIRSADEKSAVRADTSLASIREAMTQACQAGFSQLQEFQKRTYADATSTESPMEIETSPKDEKTEINNDKPVEMEIDVFASKSVNSAVTLKSRRYHPIHFWHTSISEEVDKGHVTEIQEGAWSSDWIKLSHCAVAGAAGFDFQSEESLDPFTDFIKSTLDEICTAALAQKSDGSIHVQDVLMALAHEDGYEQHHKSGPLSRNGDVLSLLKWCDLLCVADAPVPQHLAGIVDTIRATIPQVVVRAILRAKRADDAGAAESIAMRAKEVLQQPLPSKRPFAEVMLMTMQPEAAFVLSLLLGDQTVAELVLPQLTLNDIINCIAALHGTERVAKSSRIVTPITQSPALTANWMGDVVAPLHLEQLVQNPKVDKEKVQRGIIKIFEAVQPDRYLSEHAHAVVRDLQYWFVQQLTRSAMSIEAVCGSDVNDLDLFTKAINLCMPGELTKQSLTEAKNTLAEFSGPNKPEPLPDGNTVININVESADLKAVVGDKFELKVDLAERVDTTLQRVQHYIMQKGSDLYGRAALKRGVWQPFDGSKSLQEQQIAENGTINLGTKSQNKHKSCVEECRVLMTSTAAALPYSKSRFSAPSDEMVQLFSGAREYITAEVLELSGNAAGDGNSAFVTPYHIDNAIANDDELMTLLKNRKFFGQGNPVIYSFVNCTRHNAACFSPSMYYAYNASNNNDDDDDHNDDNGIPKPTKAGILVTSQDVSQTAHQSSKEFNAACVLSNLESYHAIKPAAQLADAVFWDQDDPEVDEELAEKHEDLTKAFEEHGKRVTLIKEARLGFGDQPVRPLALDSQEVMRPQLTRQYVRNEGDIVNSEEDYAFDFDRHGAPIDFEKDPSELETLRLADSFPAFSSSTRTAPDLESDQYLSADDFDSSVLSDSDTCCNLSTASLQKLLRSYQALAYDEPSITTSLNNALRDWLVGRLLWVKDAAVSTTDSAWATIPVDRTIGNLWGMRAGAYDNPFDVVGVNPVSDSGEDPIAAPSSAGYATDRFVWQTLKLMNLADYGDVTDYDAAKMWLASKDDDDDDNDDDDDDDEEIKEKAVREEKIEDLKSKYAGFAKYRELVSLRVFDSMQALLLPKRSFQVEALKAARVVAGTGVWIPRLGLAALQVAAEQYLGLLIRITVHARALFHQRVFVTGSDINITLQSLSAVPREQIVAEDPVAFCNQLGQTDASLSNAEDLDVADGQVLAIGKNIAVTLDDEKLARVTFGDAFTHAVNPPPPRWVRELEEQDKAPIWIPFTLEQNDTESCIHRDVVGQCIVPDSMATSAMRLRTMGGLLGNPKCEMFYDPVSFALLIMTMVLSKHDKVSLSNDAIALLQLVCEAKVINSLTAIRCSDTETTRVLFPKSVSKQILEDLGVETSKPLNTQDVADLASKIASIPEKAAASLPWADQCNVKVADMRCLTQEHIKQVGNFEQMSRKLLL